jgi:3-deoxy-7-phosphoheptulonate synthase
MRSYATTAPEPWVARDLPLLGAYSMGVHEAVGLAPGDGGQPLMIAGPCAIESEEMLWESAQLLSAQGVRLLRGGSYKLRTLPYSFAGPGDEGPAMHRRVAAEFGMLTVSEIVDTAQAPLFERYVDVVQVGARNMRNTLLLRCVAGIGKPVILKRDMSATLREWLSAAEHLLFHGTERLLLCERGVRWVDPTFRNVIDFGAVAWIKSYLGVPAIVDPSHGVGRADMVETMSLCAVAAGADGLMVEVHPEPTRSRCDADQALTPAELERLTRRCEALRQLLHETAWAGTLAGAAQPPLQGVSIG